jgi:hypothetical protein
MDPNLSKDRKCIVFYGTTTKRHNGCERKVADLTLVGRGSWMSGHQRAKSE